jgi:hypothetical protein
MRVASLESVLTAATLVSAIVVVLWGMKIFYGTWASRNWRRTETSGQEEVRDKSITSAAAEAFFSNCPKSSSDTSCADGCLSFAQNSSVQEGNWFQAFMHFSGYLMIAALVLMGLELAYTFYQLATIIL